MTRDARAAAALISELAELVPDLEVERDDLDGLLVYRTYRFTSKSYKGLADLLSAVADERIALSCFITDGVETTFVSDRRADIKKPYSAAHAGFLLTKKVPPKDAD